MDTQQKNAVHLLGELLVQIRGIAGDASNLGHVSALGRGRFSAEDACKAIYALTDAGHNLPSALTQPSGNASLIAAMQDLATAGADVFGDRSTFEAFTHP